MKKILKYLQNYLKEDFNPLVYASVALILALGIWSNYSLGLRRYFLGLYNDKLELYIYYATMFFGTYFLVMIVESLIRKDYSPFGNIKFLAKIAVGLLILTYDSSSRSVFLILVDVFSIPDRLFVWAFYVFASFYQVFNLGLLIALLKFLFDKDSDSTYGLRYKNVDLKPYFIMLLIMLPLIAWASFQKDFMMSYPIYKPNSGDLANYMPMWVASLSFEFFYSFRFVAVELFFRGFLIIGMIKLIGNRSLLPMVVLYSFWHFGKPMMETVGAIFGAYILGIIAMRTKSVFGGIIVHLGVALLMELAAYLQLLIK